VTYKSTFYSVTTSAAVAADLSRTYHISLNTTFLKCIWASKSTNIIDAAVLIWVEAQAHMAKATLSSLLLCTTNIKAITKHLCKQHILRLQQCKCLFCG